MMKYLPIVLFITLMCITLNSAVNECFTTNCHTHGTNHCPNGTNRKTWNFCRLVFGRYETCCYDETYLTNQDVTDENNRNTAYLSQNKDQKNDLSPLVKSISWGRVDVEGQDEHFKDVKLYPGGAVPWDWGKTGTHHQPGIQPGDLNELLENDCKIIILSRGIENRLQTTRETHDLLQQRGMKLGEDYFILQSETAVQQYNNYAKQKKRVCAVIHSTC